MLWFNPDIGRPGDHTPWKDGKGSVFEGGVPGICEWPARVKPGRTSVPVDTNDFNQNLLEVAGVAMPDDKLRPMDGITLVPLLSGKISERPKAIGFINLESAVEERIEGAR